MPDATTPHQPCLPGEPPLETLSAALHALRLAPHGTRARAEAIEQLVAVVTRASARLRTGDLGPQEREQLLWLLASAAPLVFGAPGNSGA